MIESVNEIDPRTSTEPAVLHHFREEIAAAGGKIDPTAEEYNIAALMKVAPQALSRRSCGTI